MDLRLKFNEDEYNYDKYRHIIDIVKYNTVCD